MIVFSDMWKTGVADLVIASQQIEMVRE